ncbi:MAG: RHS repeat-associated core domain-containing protein [Acidobacteriota bacterium]
MSKQHLHHPNSRPLVAPLLALLSLAIAPFALAYSPSHPVGVSDPERALLRSAEQVDVVDLYSGALSVTIPIGPWSLTYNSNLWQYETLPDDTIVASPDRNKTAGFGWHLGWGEVYHPEASYNGTGRWLYVGADGGRHVFYDKLHRDDGDDGDDGTKQVFYTRDGSYLRLRLSPCSVEIESPDGTTQKFVGTCGPQSPLRLTKVWNAFGSESDPDLTITYGADPSTPGTDDTLRTVVDRYGLTHRVYLADQIGGAPIHYLHRIVTRVEIDSFGATPAVYDFHYREVQVDVGCKDTSPSTDPRIPLPHLTAVDFPDGSSFAMEEAGQLLYYNQCESIGGRQVEDLPGVLRGLNLPTGGKIRWDFEEREFPPNESNSVFNSTASVKERRLYDAGPISSQSELGVWKYKWTAIPALPSGVPGEPHDPEMHIEVVYPTNDCSKHFFNAIYWVDPVNSLGRPRGWETGLPFAYSRESADGSLYLSSEFWSDHDGSDGCAGNLERSTYLRFRRDTTPGQGTEVYPQVDWHNTNRQVEAQRVVFHDPTGDRQMDTVWSEYDGLGHFRREVTTGNFWAGSSHGERRETSIGFNRSTGTYPGSYAPVHISEPWVLGIFDSTEVYEPDAHGQQRARSEFHFESDTGFLTCQRALAAGAVRSSRDLLTVRSRDARGRVTDQRHYGSDRQPLSTSGGGCGSVPAQPAYWLSHEYDSQSPAHLRSRARTSAGGNGPFLLYDVDVEAGTGLVLAERDPSGFERRYTYDTLGRPLTVTPDAGARTEYAYVIASASNGPRFTTTQISPTSGAVLAQSHRIFDALGRLADERRLLPGNIWSSRERQHNARGWMTSISEWGAWNETKPSTKYLSFDPFGRASVIRPPNGSTHDLKVQRIAEWKVKRKTKLALAGGETYVPRIFEYDRYGRLRTVRERSGAGGALVPTTYRYDVGGRLTSATTTSGGTTQVRNFSYDNRGFLLSETVPEKGTAGNGTLYYREYDALGLAHRRDDGPNSHALTYDLMGRLRTVRDRNAASRLLRELQWDGVVAASRGQLWIAKEYNYLDLPWNGTGEEPVIVQQTFSYDGLANAVSQKTTQLLWSSPSVRFRQGYTYSELGQVASRDFPRCDLPVTCTGPAANGRVVTYKYDSGRLTEVPGWARSITYHPSGVWKEIEHANGVRDHQDIDPSFRRRPQRLYTSAVTPGFDSGTMTYDGAGNLKTMGSHAFTYDKARRLARASYLSGAFDQSYTYDPFGNLTAVDGYTTGERSLPVNPQTNRLSGASYDAAGNLLQPPPSSSIPAWQFTYDTSNRLVGQGNQRYLYDAFGERTMQIAADATMAGGAFFLRDLDQRFITKITLDGDRWLRDRDYIYAGSRLLARASTDTFADRDFHLDHLGSVRLVTHGVAMKRAAGTYRDEHFFFPYGEREGGSANFEDSPLFTGHERDGSTGADYMHARHYLWSLGRFLSVDPVVGVTSQPQSLNRYAYTLGNPINRTDPTGLSSILVCYHDGERVECFYSDDEIVDGGRGGGTGDNGFIDGTRYYDGNARPPGTIRRDWGDGPRNGNGGGGGPDEPVDPDPEDPDEPETGEDKNIVACTFATLYYTWPVAQFEHLVMGGISAAGAMAGSAVGDVVMSPFRLVPEINQQHTAKLGQPPGSIAPIFMSTGWPAFQEIMNAFQEGHHAASAECSNEH